MLLCVCIHVGYMFNSGCLFYIFTRHNEYYAAMSRFRVFIFEIVSNNDEVIVHIFISSLNE